MPDLHRYESLARLANTQARMCDSVAYQKHPRLHVVQAELLDFILKHKIKPKTQSGYLMEALDSLKISILLDSERALQGKKGEQIMEKLVELFGHRSLNSKVKIRIAEVFGAIIYKGYVNLLDKKAHSNNLLNVVLNQLN
jgi:hypothetical protein